MSPTAVLCVACGYSAVSGSYVKAAQDRSASEDRTGALFNIMGTRTKAGIAVAVVILVGGLVFWYVGKLEHDTARTSVRVAATPSSEAPKSKPQPGRTRSRGYLGALAQVRKLGLGIGATSNMRQIGYAISLYADDHGGALPDQLEQLRRTTNGFDQLMFNQRTGEDPGFIYEKPQRADDPATTPILFESSAGQKDLNGSILYLDGHIESGR